MKTESGLGEGVNTRTPPVDLDGRSQVANREQADDLLQETWMWIHRVRHTCRQGEPVLPWVYAIARRRGKW